MRRRLVLFPLPFVGHQNPMFELGKVLRSRGFSVSVIHTRLHSPDPAKYPDFTFHFIDDGVSVAGVSFDDILVTINLLNHKCIDSLRECLSRILAEDPSTCTIVTDALWHCSQAVADDLNVPRITLRTGNMASFSVFFARLPLHLRDVDLEDLMPDHPPLRLKDIPRVNASDQSPLHDLFSMVVRATKASRGLIFNSFEEIEESSLTIIQHEFRIPIFPIGPFHKCLPSPSGEISAQDQSCLSWLDTQAPNSVLYVSFGSLASIDQAGFLDMAWGLANSKHPFLWVVRSDLVQGLDGSSRLPDEFLTTVSTRGHLVGWAPQKGVLAHPAVGGFWTHCGWNSTLESICEGVPMICSPSFADQMVDARYVTEVWRIGVWLEKGAKAEDVEGAIRKVMADKEGEEMRERAGCMKSKASMCLQPEGSSFKHMEDLVNLFV